MRTRQSGEKRPRSPSGDGDHDSSDGESSYTVTTRSKSPHAIRRLQSRGNREVQRGRVLRRGKKDDVIADVMKMVIHAVHGARRSRGVIESDNEDETEEDDEEEGDEEEGDEEEGDEEEDDDEEEEDGEIDDSDHPCFDDTEAGREMRYLSSITTSRRKEYKEHEDRLVRGAMCDVPFRFRVLDSHIPDDVKVQCLSFVRHLDDEDGEFKRRSWLERILRVPFGKYTTEDGPPKREDAAKHVAMAKSILDKVVHGNLDAKNTLREMVAQGITCPEGRMPVIGLVGPPGIGKTTLAIKGIAEVMNRPFFHISCGGMQDAGAIRGHSYTFEGSTPGAIITALSQTGVMDPVILFDEVDKLNNMPKGGADVQSVLIHLLDPTQNENFEDEYFAGLPRDLSRAIFVLSMNDSTNLSPILRDRVQLVEMDTPKTADKVEIAKGFLIPACLRNVGLTAERVHFPHETLHHAISTGATEAGVRQLKYCLEGIVRRVNMFILIGKKRTREILCEFSLNDKVQTHIIEGLFGPRTKKGTVTVTASLCDALKPRGGAPVGAPPFAMYL